jgi:hypothetical protein
MYVAVVSVILGQGLLLGQPPDTRIWRAGMAGVSFVCLGVSGAYVARQFWSRIRTVLRGGSQVGAAVASLAQPAKERMS